MSTKFTFLPTLLTTNTFYIRLFSLFVSLTFFGQLAIAQPDLSVSASRIASTLRVDYINNTDQCFINEGCVGGTGARQLLRFTTEIKNGGDTDFYVGQPPADPANENEQWEWDGCHDHWHYEGYARYVIRDVDGNTQPSSFKNGFCLMDITCTTGIAKYNCNNQGITAGCADIYSSGLDCQWVDVTDLAPGNYKLSVEVNWDQSPDANGNIESDFNNNIAEVCFTLNRSGTQVSIDQINCSDLNNGGGTSTCEDVEYTLRFKLDNYPEETTFKVLQDNGNIVAQGGPYGNLADGSIHEEKLCLPQGCYTLQIDDAYGDGICCDYGQGNYNLLDNSGNSVVSGGTFNQSISHTFCINDTPPPPPPPNEGPCPGNVLPDFGFETTGLTGWEITSRVRVVQNPYSGTKAVRLARANAQMSYTVNAHAGDDVNLCGYFKIRRNPTTAIFGIEFLDGNFNRISFESTDITSSNYTQYCQSNIAPAGTKFAKAIIYTNGNRSRLFVDDLCFDGAISYRSSIDHNFLDIDVAKAERKVQINWVSNADRFVKHYVVERSSDNINFEPIHTQLINGNNNGAMNYEAEDLDPLSGTNYYRVTQVSFGDYLVESPVKRVEFDVDLSHIEVFPNPAKDKVLVDLRAFAGKECTFTLSDNLGKIKHQELINEVPETPIELDLRKYNAGIYFITIFSEGQQKITKKFVVIKD